MQPMRWLSRLLAIALPCICGAALAAGGSFHVMHYFKGGDGGKSYSELALGNDGKFYGTTLTGGNHNAGTFFCITPDGDFQRLASFSSKDGAAPFGGVTPGNDGNFYGTTQYGGANGAGTVFRATPAGALTVLYSFSRPDSYYRNKDGANPAARLTLGSDGNWYGSAPYGGANNSGTLFRITPAGSLTVLHSFSAFSSTDTINTDGAHPISALTAAADGNFYGVTMYGGGHGTGTLFRMTPAGVLTTLHSFGPGAGAIGPGIDGAYPMTALTPSGNLLYGSTSSRGDNDAGTLFSLNPHTGQYQVLYSFSAYVPGVAINADGLFPAGQLFAAADGSLYGTTARGGKYGYGTVFHLKPPAAPVTLYNFNVDSTVNDNAGTNFSGSTPLSGLIADSSGNLLLGTTSSGGKNDEGVIFSIAPVLPSATKAPANAVTASQQR